MESDAGSSRHWTESVEDLLAFVDRASKNVKAAMKRPSKPKGRLNLRRYIQKRLNRNQDYVRDRTPAANGKKARTSMSSSCSSSKGSNPERDVPTLQNAGPPYQADLICSDIFGSIVPLENYSWNSNPSLLCGYNDDSWSSAGRNQGGHAETNETSFCHSGNDDALLTTFRCQDGLYVSASPDNCGCCMSTSDTPNLHDASLDCGSVDPVFPPENCDKIVPLITDAPFVAHHAADFAASAIQENTEANRFQFNSCMLEMEPRPLEPDFSVRATSLLPFSSLSHSLNSVVSNVD